MPAELPSRAGDEGENRLIALLERIGWTHRGDTNITLNCDYRGHPDRSNSYGIDGYMTYDGPFRKKERGFFIESKSPTFENYYPSTLKPHAKSLLQKIEAGPEAENFESLLNFDESRIVNAGILGIWFRDEDEYAPELFQEYVEEVPISPKSNGRYQIQILENRNLNRLASMADQIDSLRQEYNGEKESLSFFYPSRSDSNTQRLPTLILEYMASDIVFAKLIREHSVVRGTTEEVNIVFHFGEISLDSLDFMYNAILEYSVDDCEEIWVYVYENENDEGRRLQLNSIEDEFERNGKPSRMPSKGPDLDLNRCNKVKYDDYTDRILEEYE